LATISLVSIVRDEEKVLERAIESVKSIVDEFCIVDTGSKDSTKEIIARYGTVYELPFEDYVTTKNKALSLATSDYILFLDADEYLISGLEFLKEHAETGSNCVNAEIVEGEDGNYSQIYIRARLWRNDGSWAYAGPGVHESLLPSKDATTITDHRIRVKHDHSHKDISQYHAKFLGYVQILNNFLKDHPNDPRANFYLGRTHKDLGNWLAAIESYRKYLTLNTAFLDEKWQSAFDIAACFKAQGEYDRAMEACDLAEKIDPRRAENFILKGQMFFEMQNVDAAIAAFEKAASLPIPTDILLFLNPRAHNEIAWDYLVMLYDRKKDYQTAHKYAKKMSDKLPKPDGRIVHNLQFLNRMRFKTIFFALGKTPEPVFPGIMDKTGLGGVEQAFVELSFELGKRGHNCFLFCSCPEEAVYNGVYYVPFEKIEEYKNLKPDVIITSRWYDANYMFPDAKRILWMQDAHFADPNHPDAWETCNAAVVSSLWHRFYVAERLGQRLDAKKLNIIPLAIRYDLFQNKNIERNPLKTIYASNPDRGLYQLMGMWDEISQKVPGITLSVCYGWNGLRTWGSDPAWLAKIDEDEKRVTDWATKSGNVRITGRITKAELAKEMLSSSLLLYPNNFWETYCLVATESEAAGLVAISTRLGALVTTFSDLGNILIDDNPFSENYKRKFIDATVELMQNPIKRNKLSKICVAHFEQQPNWEQVSIMWENLFYRI
jgi:glycosyltransferase involved in cell wall biosynthesis